MSGNKCADHYYYYGITSVSVLISVVVIDYVCLSMLVWTLGVSAPISILMKQVCTPLLLFAFIVMCSWKHFLETGNYHPSAGVIDFPMPWPWFSLAMSMPFITLHITHVASFKGQIHDRMWSFCSDCKHAILNMLQMTSVAKVRTKSNLRPSDKLFHVYMHGMTLL